MITATGEKMFYTLIQTKNLDSSYLKAWKQIYYKSDLDRFKQGTCYLPPLTADMA